MRMRSLFLAMALAAAHGAVTPAAPGGKLGGKLDVLMLAVDDMRPELGCYGCEYMHTPNLDQLAAESMVLERMYVGYALCSPSRTILLTSRRPDTSRVWNISEYAYWRTSGGNFTTLPEFFKVNDYLTLGAGKIFHPGVSSNNNDRAFSWSPECLPYVEDFPDPAGTPSSRLAIAPVDNVTDDEMGEGKLASKMVDLLQLIKKRRDEGSAQPFFMAAGFHRPHIPWHAPRKYYDMYDPNLPLAPHQHLPINVPQIAINPIWSGPHSYWDSFRDLAAVNNTAKFPYDNTTAPVDAQRKIRQAYRAAVSFTDRNIGVVLKALKDLGLYDTTIIIFWSDHGYQLGDNNQWAKHTNFEHATRIPFMVRLPPVFFPSFKPGRSKQLLDNIDLFPTLVDLAIPEAKLEPCPTNMHQSRLTDTCTEGHSFASFLLSESTPASRSWTNASYSQYSRQHESIMGYSVRVEGYRYTEWVPFNSSRACTVCMDWSTSLGVELYQHRDADTDEDCRWDYEHHNVAPEPAFKPTVDLLSAMVRAFFQH